MTREALTSAGERRRAWAARLVGVLKAMSKPGSTSWPRRILRRRKPNVGHLEGLYGNVAVGWVWNPKAPQRPAFVEFLVDERVIHTSPANSFRPDVAAAGYGNGLAGFIVELPLDVTAGAVQVTARLAKTKHELGGSPKVAEQSQDLRRWLGRKERVKGRFRQRLSQRLSRSVGERTLSIVVPVYNTRPDWLRECLSSVVEQWCPDWELICVDDHSSNPETRRVLEDFARDHDKIRVIRNETNLGIAKSTNIGIFASSGTHIAFLDHDDYLEPDAVFRVLKAADTGAELIYSDEILTSECINTLVTPQMRPAFSWDYYINHPYFVHFIGVSAALAKAIGGWDERMKISGDVDFVLRVIERATSVAHVPAILYRWRTHGASAGHTMRDEVVAATTSALNRHLARVSPRATSVPTALFNYFEARFPDSGGRTLIVIPTRNRVDLLRRCVDSLLATTKPGEVDILVVDHESDDPETVAYLAANRDRFQVYRHVGPFNFAALNNRAVEAYERERGSLPPFVLFSNNDIEAIEPGWLERMRGLAARPDVGAVGATLLYANGSVQHSGVIVGLNGPAEHAHKFASFRHGRTTRNAGPLGMLVCTREYSAVTAAFMMMRSDVFRQVGGFDETFEVGFNDTDLCLRIGEAGLKILNDASSALSHHESATRRAADGVSHPEDTRRFFERWAKILADGDPFYNPLMSLEGPDHRQRRFCTDCPRPRVRPGLGLK
ncbi:glycosyltransferase family 2 protein [Methylobacterium soli]|nr:glycosyltransferase family 2 protein [Methylobacterium soli]